MVLVVFLYFVRLLGGFPFKIQKGFPISKFWLRWRNILSILILPVFLTSLFYTLKENVTEEFYFIYLADMFIYRSIVLMIVCTHLLYAKIIRKIIRRLTDLEIHYNFHHRIFILILTIQYLIEIYYVFPGVLGLDEHMLNVIARFCNFFVERFFHVYYLFLSFCVSQILNPLFDSEPSDIILNFRYHSSIVYTFNRTLNSLYLLTKWHTVIKAVDAAIYSMRFIGSESISFLYICSYFANLFFILLLPDIPQFKVSS